MDPGQAACQGGRSTAEHVFAVSQENPTALWAGNHLPEAQGTGGSVTARAGEVPDPQPLSQAKQLSFRPCFIWGFFCLTSSETGSWCLFKSLGSYPSSKDPYGRSAIPRTEKPARTGCRRFGHRDIGHHAHGGPRGCRPERRENWPRGKRPSPATGHEAPRLGHALSRAPDPGR